MISKPPEITPVLTNGDSDVCVVGTDVFNIGTGRRQLYGSRGTDRAKMYGVPQVLSSDRVTVRSSVPEAPTTIQKEAIKVSDATLRVVDPALTKVLLENKKSFFLVDEKGIPIRKGAHSHALGEKHEINVEQLIWGESGLYAVGTTAILDSKTGTYTYHQITQPLESLARLTPITIGGVDGPTAGLEFEYVSTDPEKAYLDTEAGIQKAIECLEQFGIAIVDFGSTWGIVFRTDMREPVADLRGERIGGNTKLPYASLVTSMEMTKQLVPDALQPGTNLDRAAIIDLLEVMRGVGFVRYTPDLTTLPDEEKEYITRYFMNAQGQSQFYPINHPLFDAWAAKHPESPLLGVRSANITGSQEQAFSRGAVRLAKLMGVPTVAFLSHEHERVQQEDEPRLDLKLDALGLHTGVLGGKKTERERMGSVPICVVRGVNIQQDPLLSQIAEEKWYSTDGKTVKRDGLLDQDVSVVVERVGNVSPEVLIRLIGWYCQRYNLNGAVATNNRDFRTGYSPEFIAELVDILPDAEMKNLVQQVAAAALFWAKTN